MVNVVGLTDIDMKHIAINMAGQADIDISSCGTKLTAARRALAVQTIRSSLKILCQPASAFYLVILITDKLYYTAFVAD